MSLAAKIATRFTKYTLRGNLPHLASFFLFLQFSVCLFGQAQYIWPSISSMGSISAPSVAAGVGASLTGDFVAVKGSSGSVFGSVTYTGPTRVNTDLNYGPDGKANGIKVDVTPFSALGTYTLQEITFIDAGFCIYKRNGTIEYLFPSYPTTGQPTRHNLDFSKMDFRIVTPVAPSITQQPVSLVSALSSSASFSVVVSGTGPLTYQWFKDGVAIPSSSTGSLSFNPISASDSGSYSVKVTNSAGSATSNSASLTISPSITTQPVSTTAFTGGNASFSVVANGTAPLSYQWRKDGAVIAGATSATYTLSSVSASSAGGYSVTITNTGGSITSSSVNLTVSAILPPSVTTQPVSTTVFNGGNASFSVVANGTAPLSYQWRKDGAVIAGATSAVYALTSVALSDSGTYTVVVSNSAGSVTTNPAILAIQSPRLSNLSVRTSLDANQVLIVGLTMSGGSKNVLLRAVGPTLSVFGVAEAMADPKIDLFNGSSKISTNDNWGGGTALAASFQSVGAFGYSSPTSLDAALVTSIDGGRTVQVSGPTAGTVLVEGYDAGTGDSPRFTNLSARNKVGTGGNILIAGFTLSGSGTRNLLIRAVGAKLAEFGVSGVLADPKLQIYRDSTKIAENDNWDASLVPTFVSVGAFGLTSGSKDAAIITSLPAGGYTVQVSGSDGGVGEALIEIYELP